MFGKHSTKKGVFRATGGHKLGQHQRHPGGTVEDRASGQWTEILPSDTCTPDLETTLEDPFGLVLEMK